jgi:G:T/U-mismatch repair DNA glycosylase
LLLQFSGFIIELNGGEYMECSIHPYREYIPENASKLIIGTIPPFRFCVSGEKRLYPRDVDFYYGSRDNGFWSLMSEVTQVKLCYENTKKAVDQRKRLLKELNAGITDIVEKCIHKDGKSDDASLEIIELKDLNKLLLNYPNIEELIYTSIFVARQVSKIADKKRHAWSPEDPKRGHVVINQVKYPVTVLYSPSPNALRGVSKEKRLAQYRAVFGVNQLFTYQETPGQL